MTKLGAPERHAPPYSLFSAFIPLLALMLATFAGIFANGMALPVVPQHVHDTLGQARSWSGWEWRFARGGRPGGGDGAANLIATQNPYLT